MVFLGAGAAGTAQRLGESAEWGDSVTVKAENELHKGGGGPLLLSAALALMTEYKAKHGRVQELSDQAMRHPSKMSH